MNKQAGAVCDNEGVIRDWISAREAAEIIGIKQISVYAAIREGHIEATRFDGYILVSRTSAEHYRDSPIRKPRKEKSE